MAATFYGPRRKLQVSDDDLLWAGRGLVGEEGEGQSRDTAAAMLWALLHRCLLMPNELDYGQMWRAFSQPINSRWRRDGDFCRPGGRYFGSQFCSEAKLARRERISQIAWEELPISLRVWLKEFQAGQLAPPDAWASLSRPRVSNWGSATVLSSLPAKYPWGYRQADEWMFEDKGLLAGAVSVDTDYAPVDIAEPSVVPKVLAVLFFIASVIAAWKISGR